MPNGRVEGKYTVPSGTTVSVSSGASATATSVTWTAGSYFHTASGSTSSGLTVLQTAINAAVGPYPATAAAMQAAVGYGTWSSGWLFQIASGNDAGAFGGVTMTAVSSPTYQNAGPATGTDYAVGFDSASDAFDAGAVYDVGANDLCVAWVAKFSTTPAAYGTIVSKVNATPNAGWHVFVAPDGVMYAEAFDGVGTQQVNVGTAGVCVGEWHVGMLVIDRSAGTMRLATKGLTSGTATVSSTDTVSGNITTAETFCVGDSDWTSSATFLMSAVYIGSGSGAATGMSANLATAIANFANCINSSFSVSLSTTTGLVTLSNSFWPCAMSPATNARSLLGFAYDFDYPSSASAVATALGYGTWTSGAGYLCNETSGNLAAAFGSPATLTASSLTYSNQGARGGTDKAIGFDANGDYADGGDYFDVTGTDDIIALWVARVESTPTGSVDTLVSKFTTGGWLVALDTSGYVYCQGYDTVGNQLFSTFNTSTAANCVGCWHAGIFTIDRATGKACVGTVNLTTGATSVSAETTTAATSMANAVGFRIGERADSPSTAPTTTKIAAVYIVTGSGVATGLSANLSTALSNFATYMKSQTGTTSARGCWIVDCPLNLDGDPTQAPRATDLRQSESPTGIVLGLVSNYKYRHRGLRWEAVSKACTWESAATYTYGSYEGFSIDVLYGLGHSWFTPSSMVQVYWDNAGSLTTLGSAQSIDGWYVKNVTSIEPRLTTGSFTGLWRIDWPELVSNG